MVKVSVVVPVFDPGEYIEPLLDSLRGQSLPAGEWEAVFVDDGSSDGTPERLAALAARHAHLRFAAIPRSGWPGRPRNTGIDLAAGEYVFFADQDDWLGPEALERLYAMAVADDADIVIGKVVGHGKGVPRNVFAGNRHGLTALDVPFTLLTPHKLFRRRLLDAHGLRFPEGPRRLEDHAFVVPAFFHARRISILADYPCYHWARRPDRGNASGQPADLPAYFAAVREVLDVVDAHTEPGPLRDRLYLRWYRGKVLARFARADFPRDDADQRRAAFMGARALAQERFPPALDARLEYATRLSAALLRRGDLPGLEALAGFAGALRARATVRSVGGDGTWLTLRLTGRLRTRGEPHPLRVGADRRLVAAGSLRAHLNEDELDLTGALSAGATGVFLKARAGGAEWELPTERSVALLETGDGTLRPQVRMLARLSPTIAAAGAPLTPGEYEVHAVVAVAGFFASTPVLRAGEPFVVTVTPALRLEHPRPPPGPPPRPAGAPPPPAPAARGPAPRAGGRPPHPGPGRLEHPRARARRAAGSAQDARVAEGVAPGLRPHAHAVRPAAHRDAPQQPAAARAQRVDLGVVAPGEPEHAPVGRHAAHVGRAAARDAPLRHRPARAERQHADRALAPVGDEQPARVAARVQAVRAAPGRLEAQLAPAARVDQPHAVGRHVGHVERPPVR